MYCRRMNEADTSSLAVLAEVSVSLLSRPSSTLSAAKGFRKSAFGVKSIRAGTVVVPQLFEESLLRSPYLSPLRYPGAKRQLVPVIQGLIAANIPPPTLFVEPFCGGCSTSLRLLVDDQIQRTWLNDLDPLVYAFWRVAAFDTLWLIDAMHSEPVTVDRWEAHRSSRPRSLRDRALKCLFLNRTTFSGILHKKAGPIGGKKQDSDYKIDCRFNKPQLEQRLRLVGALAACGAIVDVSNLDYEALVSRLRRELVNIPADEVVLYFDPPYVNKAKTLYEWNFADRSEHDRLVNVLAATKWRWVLSYDDHAEVRARYSDVLQSRTKPQPVTTLVVSARYSAASETTRTNRSELLLTNMPEVPDPAGPVSDQGRYPCR